jgi:putative oxidoreductase
MSLLLLIGRLLFSAIFLAAAPRHFTAEAAAHAAELGVPLARLAVPASGLLALAGGLSVLAGYHTRLGAWLLVAFLVPVTVMMHAFWRLADLPKAAGPAAPLARAAPSRGHRRRWSRGRYGRWPSATWVR